MTLEEIVSLVLSNPTTAIAVLIQFALGLALGYFSAKVLKYILALLAVLVLGSMLSVWTTGISFNEIVSSLRDLAEPLRRLVTVVGLFTLGPVSVGFIVGVLLALRK